MRITVQSAESRWTRILADQESERNGGIPGEDLFQEEKGVSSFEEIPLWGVSRSLRPLFLGGNPPLIKMISDLQAEKGTRPFTYLIL